VKRPREVVVVLGSRRSGARELAGTLGELGYRISEPEESIDPARRTVSSRPDWLADFHASALHEALVHAADARPSAWADTGRRCLDDDVADAAHDWLGRELDHSPRIVLQDPQIVWFTTLWNRAAADLDAELKFIIMMHHPAAAVAARDHWLGTELTAASRAGGWLNAQLYTERATRRCRRVFVSYERLALARDSTLEVVGDLLGLKGVSTGGVRALSDLGSIDNGVSAMPSSWDALGVSQPLADLVTRTWATFETIDGVGDVDPTLHPSLDDLRVEYCTLYAASLDVAQSVVWAAGHEEVKHASTMTPEVESASPPPTLVQESGTRPNTLMLRLARRIPVGVRHAVPLELRRRLLGRSS
jgi:hypothetical protein